ncbi:CAP domain [Trinorchestia longiramus]|nr:CAP domain [Trinorchestia longiramus]
MVRRASDRSTQSIKGTSPRYPAGNGNGKTEVETANKVAMEGSPHTSEGSRPVGRSGSVPVRHLDRRSSFLIQDIHRNYTPPSTTRRKRVGKGSKDGGESSSTSTENDINADPRRVEEVDDLGKEVQGSTKWKPSSFTKQCIAAHNLYRQRHSAPPLILDQELCRLAQAWANHVAHTGVVRYTANHSIGENILCRTARRVRGKLPPPPSGKLPLHPPLVR